MLNRFVTKYVHKESSLTVKMTDDVVCLQFKTNQIQVWIRDAIYSSSALASKATAYLSGDLEEWEASEKGRAQKKGDTLLYVSRHFVPRCFVIFFIFFRSGKVTLTRQYGLRTRPFKKKLFTISLFFGFDRGEKVSVIRYCELLALTNEIFKCFKCNERKESFQKNF